MVDAGSIRTRAILNERNIVLDETYFTSDDNNFFATFNPAPGTDLDIDTANLRNTNVYTAPNLVTMNAYRIDVPYTGYYRIIFSATLEFAGINNPALSMFITITDTPITGLPYPSERKDIVKVVNMSGVSGIGLELPISINTIQYLKSGQHVYFRWSYDSGNTTLQNGEVSVEEVPRFVNRGET